MAQIAVQQKEESAEGFRFEVTVSEASSESRHEVTLSRADYESWSQGATPKDFIERCFQFLLAREPKESILSRFDARDIGRYFPGFEEEVTRS